jgi:hypothetical protein
MLDAVHLQNLDEGFFGGHFHCAVLGEGQIFVAG